MDIQLAIADVILNEGESPKRMLVIFNEYGTLLVDKELFSISFDGAIPANIKVDYIKSVKV